MKVKRPLFLMGLLYLNTACEPAGNCPDALTFGPYFFDEASRAYTPPFDPQDTLVFRNEAGDELAFFLLRMPLSGPQVFNAWEVLCDRSGEEFTRVRLQQDQLKDF